MTTIAEALIAEGEVRGSEYPDLQGFQNLEGLGLSIVKAQIVSSRPNLS